MNLAKAVKVTIALAKQAYKLGKTFAKTAVKIGKNVAAKAVPTAKKGLQFLKQHPNLVKSLATTAIIDFGTNAIEVALAKSGIQTDEVKAYIQWAEKYEKELESQGLSVEDFEHVIDSEDIRDKRVIRNHPENWFPSDENVSYYTPDSPTKDVMIPSINGVTVRNYIYGKDLSHLLDTNPVVVEQLAQTVQAYYRGLSLQIPSFAQAKVVSQNIMMGLFYSERALSKLFAKKRFDDGWLTSTNYQAGAGGLLLGMYCNAFGPLDFPNRDLVITNLPNQNNYMAQGYAHMIGSDLAYGSGSNPEFSNGIKQLTPTGATTALARDRYYGVTISNKVWAEIVTRIKTLPVSKDAAAIAYYMFSGVFKTEGKEFNADLNYIVYHPQANFTVVIDDTTGGHDWKSDIEQDIQLAESYLTSDRSITPILNLLGLYGPLGKANVIDSRNYKDEFDPSDWRSFNFTRKVTSDYISIRNYDESLNLAMVNADYLVYIPYAAGTNAKKFPMVSYVVSKDEILWNTMLDVKPGGVYQDRRKTAYAKAGEIASILKFVWTGYLVPGVVGIFDTGDQAVEMNFLRPSMGLWVNSADTLSAERVSYNSDKRLLFRPNADSAILTTSVLKSSDFFDGSYFDMENRQSRFDTSQPDKGFTPLNDVDSRFTETRVPDLNTVYDWQYWNLYLGNSQLKPIIDKLQIIEVSAAGKI